MAEILKSVGWPHLTFLFGLFFVLLFRKPLYNLITRITSIDKSGIKTGQNPEAQRELQKKESVQKLLLAVSDSVVLKNIEDNIKAELTKQGLATEGDTIKVLIKYLASSMMLMQFEQVHSFIFGSQISLLKNLNEVRGQGKPREFIEAHFEVTRNLYSQQLVNWTMDQYLSFLLERQLITTVNNVYHITNMGVEYLMWIAKNGRTELKIL
jgi:hypothetical protein